MKLKYKILIVLLVFCLVSNAWAKPVTSKIIDGTRVPVTNYPYVAHLKVQGQTQCSGTLVGPKHILTAAHCFFNDNNVRGVGDTAMTAVLGGQEYQSSKVFINPAYHSRSQACVEGETDAAVIELSSEVNGITPIKLIDSQPPLGSQLTLIGFGLEGTGSSGQVNRFPPDGFVNVGNTILEGLGESPPEQNPNSSYIYWGFESGEANTAAGDSGGPAFYPVGNEYHLAAITCGGEDNAQFGTLSFDTRTDLIKPWVECITGDGSQNLPPCLLNQSSVAAAVLKPFSYIVSAGGTAPVTITAEGLPEGLTFDGSNISGTPTKAGKFNVRLRASNNIGNAESTLAISVAGFQSSLTVRKVLLQFDYQSGSKDFLDITGKVNVGRNFKPGGKKVIVQIGRFRKQFRLLPNGFSASGNNNYFDLEGRISNSRFTSKTVRYFLTLERLDIFDEIATLGFPSTVNASEGQEVPLPFTVTIDGVESTATVILVFRSTDARWRIK